MKLIKTLLFTLIATVSLNANTASVVDYSTSADSVNIMVEASLFFEAYKIKQYEMWTIEKGFNVVNNQPDFIPKYKIYKKIDKVIFEVYADSATTEETKAVLADTILYLYDLAVIYDSADAGSYMIKRGYILNEWKNAPVEEAIAAYEEGFGLDTDVSNEIYYLDKLGFLYESNMSEENDYQMKALDVYLKLSDLEPDNGRWPAIVARLADDEEQLKEFLQKAWYADKENGEKAWKYARMCKRLEDYQSAIEPLQFLIDQNPEVINYWNEIARAYQKNDQTDMAVDSYKKLINLQPDNRDSYFNLALLYKDMGQLSVSRSYLNKAAKASPGWDYPLFIEAGLYEQSARSCGFEFEDKCVYQLAVETYARVARMGGDHASQATDRVNALVNSVPTKEDFFFRKLKSGDVIEIKGRCYDWIGKSITVSL